jgi:hypothetical protein
VGVYLKFLYLLVLLPGLALSDSLCWTYDKDPDYFIVHTGPVPGTLYKNKKVPGSVRCIPGNTPYRVRAVVNGEASDHSKVGYPQPATPNPPTLRVE